MVLIDGARVQLISVILPPDPIPPHDESKKVPLHMAQLISPLRVYITLPHLLLFFGASSPYRPLVTSVGPR